MESYVSVVPRLLPSQYLSKRIPLADEAYEYTDQNRSISSNLSPQGNVNGPLSTRAQLNQKNIIQPGDNYPKGRTNSTRLYHEPLKDNSFNDPYDRNLSEGYQYGSHPESKIIDHQNSNSFALNRSTKMIIFIFGIIICLFSLTALAISIYLLVRITNLSTTG